MSAPKRFNADQLMTVLLAPVVSEKSTRVADKNRQYVFRVTDAATKPEIKAAVELLFKTKVDSVTVSVVIYRDGRVKSHEILQRSGNASMDRSIEATLQNVTYVGPFPSESKDLERKFTIKFNLAAKRAIG